MTAPAPHRPAERPDRAVGDAPTRAAGVPKLGYVWASDLRFLASCGPGLKEFPRPLALGGLPAYGDHNI